LWQLVGQLISDSYGFNGPRLVRAGGLAAVLFFNVVYRTERRFSSSLVMTPNESSVGFNNWSIRCIQTRRSLSSVPRCSTFACQRPNRRIPQPTISSLLSVFVHLGIGNMDSVVFCLDQSVDYLFHFIDLLRIADWTCQMN
jgi:hypothetical protein